MPSWDDMLNKVEDGQPSGGKLRKALDYPFNYVCMDVRNEYGTIMGELVIEELIPLEKTKFNDKSVRAGLWWAADAQPAQIVKPEEGAFPDEDK